MPIVFLSLNDLDAKIRAFEEKYQISSLEMLKDKDARRRIGEDVVLKWEAYVEQRISLRDVHEQTHRDYLSTLKRENSPKPRSKGRSKKDRKSCDIAYAA